MSSPPRQEHNFEDRPKAPLKKHLTFSTSKRPNLSRFGHAFQPYRFAVQSFSMLSLPCPPSYTPKIFANMCTTLSLKEIAACCSAALPGHPLLRLVNTCPDAGYLSALWKSGTQQVDMLWESSTPFSLNSLTLRTTKDYI